MKYEKDTAEFAKFYAKNANSGVIILNTKNPKLKRHKEHKAKAAKGNATGIYQYW